MAPKGPLEVHCTALCVLVLQKNGCGSLCQANHALIETRNHLWCLSTFGKKDTYVCRTPGYEPTHAICWSCCIAVRSTVQAYKLATSQLACCPIVRPYCRIVPAGGSPALIVYFLLQCSHNFKPDSCTTQSLSEGVNFWSATEKGEAAYWLPQPCRGESHAKRDSAGSLILSAAEQAGT